VRLYFTHRSKENKSWRQILRSFWGHLFRSETGLNNGSSDFKMLHACNIVKRGEGIEKLRSGEAIERFLGFQ
jgi:hypothetical protein